MLDSDQNNDPGSHNQREKELFFSAREIEDPEKRSIWLKEACGKDKDLYQRLEGLLAAEATEGMSFLKPNDDRLGEVVAVIEQELQTEMTPPEADHDLSEQIGDSIGRYKLLQKLGEGGGGVVYLSQQSEPVKRKVALKIIKLGMDTRQVVARFEAERQALAMMDHPNIAKVFDAGATGSGRPYFVMELVKGVPITTFCDENRLSAKERLELFMQVCEAVQHAHQKGIIHRDLKPGNVLVTMMEDRPVPKVIDFGIAKATQQELTEKTIFTQHGHFIGTPAYMSPEQASLTGYDIDTRSDIYALGVLLYELLTGKTPFDSTQLFKAGYEEIRRVIAEDEPPKPSTRISSMAGGEITDIARVRKSEPRRLSRLVQGDLDWIVMKALEKDRRRRYETASGFALDLQRHLDDKPVLAGPPSVGYRLKKFTKRNRRMLASVAAVLVALGVGLSMAIGPWLEKRERRAQILQKADSFVTAAQQPLERYLASSEYLDDEDFRQASESSRRAEVLLAEIDDQGSEVRQRSRDLQAEVEKEARGRTLVTSIEEAIFAVANAALDLNQSDTAQYTNLIEEAFNNSGLISLEASIKDSVSSINELREPHRYLALSGLGYWSLLLEGKEPEKAAKLAAILEAADPDPWRRKMRVAIKEEDTAALAALAKSPDLEDQPSEVLLQFGLNQQIGESMHKILRLSQQKDPTDFWANFQLGVFLASSLTSDGAKERSDGLAVVSEFEFNGGPKASRFQKTKAIDPEYDEAIGFLRAAMVARPDVVAARLNLGRSLSAGGRFEEAINILDKAIAEFPDFSLLGMAKGQVLFAQGRFADALPILEEGVNRNPEFHGGYALLGMALANIGRYEDARTALLKAGKFTEEIPGAWLNLRIHGIPLEDGHDERGVSLQIASIQSLRGDHMQAFEACQQLLKNNPDDTCALVTRGVCELGMGKYEDAEASLKKALELGAESPDIFELYGLAILQQGRSEEALIHFEKALTFDITFKHESSIRNNMAAALKNLGRTEDAMEQLRRALKLNDEYAISWENLAKFHFGESDHQKALECFRKAIAFGPNIPSINANLGSLLLHLKELPEAEKYLKIATELDDKLTLSWIDLGNTYLLQEKNADALECFKKFVEIAPEDPKGQYFLALTYHGMSRPRDCRRHAEIAIQLAPKYGDAHFILGMSWFEESKYEEALPHLIGAAKWLPEVDDSASSVGFPLIKKICETKLLIALLTSCRIDEADLLHGDCGNNFCRLGKLGKRDQKIRDLVKEKGLKDPQINELLMESWADYGHYIDHKFPNAQEKDLLEAWENHRAEIIKRLGTATVRIIWIPRDEEAEIKARDLIGKLDNGDDFGKLAVENRQNFFTGEPTETAYGDRFTELSEAAFSLKVGDYTREGIVHASGIYLLKVEDRKPGEAKEFNDSVREVTQAFLVSQQKEAWKKRYLERLQNPAPDAITANMRHLMGTRALEAEDFKRAKELLEPALKILTDKLGAQAPEVIQMEKDLQRCLKSLAKPDVVPGEENHIFGGLLYDQDTEHEIRSVDAEETALEDLQRAGIVGGKISQAYMKLGLAYQKDNRMEKAIESFNTGRNIARKTFGDHHISAVDCLLVLGKAHILNDDFPEALTALKSSLTIQEKLGRKEPDFTSTLTLLGGVSNSMGEYEKAIFFLNRASEIQKKNPGLKSKNRTYTLSQIGFSQAKLGQTKEARESYEAAFAIERSSELLGTWGQLLKEQDEFEEAEEVLREAINKMEKEEDPTLSFALSIIYSNLGGVYQKMGELGKARDSLEEALNLARNRSGHDLEVATILNNLAGILRENNELGKAEMRAKEAIEMAKRHYPQEKPTLIVAQLHLELASIQKRIDDPLNAERNTLKAIEMMRLLYPDGNPKLGEALVKYSEILIDNGGYQHAIQFLREAYDRNIDGNYNEPWAVGASALLGTSLNKTGKLEEAEAHLSESLKLIKPEEIQDARSFALLHSQLALTLIQRKVLPETKQHEREAEAERLAGDAVRICRSHPATAKGIALIEQLHLQASVLIEVGKADEAEKGITEFLALATGLPQFTEKDLSRMHTGLAIAYTNQGLHPEAGEQLQKSLAFIKEPGERVQILSHLARTLTRNGKYAEAEETVRKSFPLIEKIKKDKTKFELNAGLILGEVLLNRGNYHLAEQEFKSALKIAPDSHTSFVQILIAQALHAQGEYQQAVAEYRKILDGLNQKDQKRRLPALTGLAGSLLADNNLDEAERSVRESMVIEKTTKAQESPGKIRLLAMILREQGKLGEASPLFQKALVETDKQLDEGHPKRAPVRVEFAKLLVKQGEFAEALKLANEALELQENALRADHPQLKDTFEVLKDIHTGLKNPEQASDFETRAKALGEKK